MAKIVQYTSLKNLSTEALADLYRSKGIDYPKFFKMDALCKAGFLLAEDVVNKADNEFLKHKDNTSVIVFTSNGTLRTDIGFERTIADPENRFPSPSYFVYTLPNIVAGEIAIRHGFMGETAVYITEHFLPTQIEGIVDDTIAVSDYVLAAWIDTIGDTTSALMFLISRTGNDDMTNFDAGQLEGIYNQCFGKYKI